MFPVLALRFLDPPSKTCSSLQVLKKKAKLCLTISFIGSGPQKKPKTQKVLANSAATPYGCFVAPSAL